MILTRRKFFRGMITVAGGSILASCRPSSKSITADPLKGEKPTDLPVPLSASERRSMLFVGSYGEAGESNLYRYRLDPTRGSLNRMDEIPAGVNPSFLAFHPNGRFQYAVNETAPGFLSAFSIDPASGRLTFLNRQSSQGDVPCHLSVDRKGKFLFAANYGGSLTVCGLPEDGRIGGTIQTIRNEGRSVNPERQEGPHPHWVGSSPDNRFVLCCDLGLDKVLIYALDPGSGRLTCVQEAACAPGAGPRHLAFHPAGKTAYVINELDSTISTFAYSPETGSLDLLQNLSTLPEDWSGENFPAEVCLDPSGRFVYGSNRGHDSLAVFAVDDKEGRLTLIQHAPAHAEFPRSIAVSPAGSFLFAAGQNNDRIAAFSLDPDTGRLTFLGQTADVRKPVCLTFWETGNNDSSTE